MNRKKTNWRQLGDPNYFDDRHKRKILNLADIEPSDVLYDLGCGHANILILAAKEFGVKNAVGYEINYQRAKIAKINVEKAGLASQISILHKSMYDADLENADVMFSVHQELADDFKYMWNQKIRCGTRLIKHDLPLLGYLPDKTDIPFYRMTYPLKKAKNKSEWAKAVLKMENATISEVWRELAYYEYEKRYSDADVARLRRILNSRLVR